jgi:hypothetical protein
MRIVANWRMCDDGVTRPLIDAHVVGAHDVSFYERLLIDSGADRTVLTADLARRLKLPTELASDKVVGIGGEVRFLLIKTVIELVCDNGRPVHLRGEFAAAQYDAVIDVSVLGRDILDHFDVILSRRNDDALLLAQDHRYTVHSL